MRWRRWPHGRCARTRALLPLDVPARQVVGPVTGVGNETYLLALLPGRP
jgi:hypothetical protein